MKNCEMNGLRFRQPAYMSISDVTDEPKVWKKIPSHVVDRYGNTIAQWSDPENPTV